MSGLLSIEQIRLFPIEVKCQNCETFQKLSHLNDNWFFESGVLVKREIILSGDCALIDALFAGLRINNERIQQIADCSSFVQMIGWEGFNQKTVNNLSNVGDYLYLVGGMRIEQEKILDVLRNLDEKDIIVENKEDPAESLTLAGQFVFDYNNYLLLEKVRTEFADT